MFSFSVDGTIYSVGQIKQLEAQLDSSFSIIAISNPSQVLFPLSSYISLIGRVFIISSVTTMVAHMDKYTTRRNSLFFGHSLPQQTERAFQSLSHSMPLSRLKLSSHFHFTHEIQRPLKPRLGGPCCISGPIVSPLSHNHCAPVLWLCRDFAQLSSSSGMLFPSSYKPQFFTLPDLYLNVTHLCTTAPPARSLE